MFYHFLISFYRTFKKNISYHSINLIGLAAGITASLFLYLYCNDELSFDQFHEDYSRIYKVVDTYTFSDESVNSATISAPMGPALVSTFPEVELVVRINKLTGLFKPEKNEENEFQFDRVLVVDSGFFQLFSFPLLVGDPVRVLREPNTIVLTESTAQKLFGDSNPIGQLIKTNLLGGQTMVVSGLMKDPPTNSHIQFDMLVSHVSMINVITTLNHWLVYGTHTYIKVKPATDPEVLRIKFKDLVLQNIGPEMASKYNHHLAPIEGIHLGISRRGDLEPGGSRIVIYIFMAVGFLLLFLVTANFISLSISIAGNRIKECGIRKCLGSSRTNLILQLMIESCVISLSAALLAIGLSLLFLSSFNLLSGKTFLVSQLIAPEILFCTILVGLVLGVVSGLFPSFFLARLDPVLSLKKISSPNVYGKHRLRNALVVSQFTVVITLLISIAIIRQQLDYFRNHDVGFTKSSAIVIPINSPLVVKNRIVLEDEFKTLAGVSGVSTSSSLPSKNIGFGPFRLEGGSLDDNAILNVMSVDDNYLGTLELRLVAGRSFDRNLASDSTSFILNETAMRSLGISTADEALGKNLEMHGANKDAGALKRGPIIGVIKNFHFKSLKEEVEPLVMHIGKSGYSYFLVRINSNLVTNTLNQIKRKWEEVEPSQGMVFSFLEEDLTKLYQSEERLGRIFTMFNYLTLIIGCIGLYSLSSYVILRKAKEISVRKVLGATSGQLLYRFGVDFIKLVVLAFILACPIAYYSAQEWLETFAYYDPIRPISFISGGLLAILIACVTISYHAVSASLTNPIKNLRSE